MRREIVIDASAIIAVIVDEPRKAGLIAATAGADLVAPESIPWEIGNAFSAMLKRRRVTVEQAVRAVQIYGSIPIRLVSVDLADALRLSDHLGIYAYDAYLLCCAQRMKAPLLSLDAALVSAAQALGIQVVEVA